MYTDVRRGINTHNTENLDDLKNQKTKGRVQTSKNSYSRICSITTTTAAQLLLLSIIYNLLTASDTVCMGITDTGNNIVRTIQFKSCNVMAYFLDPIVHIFERKH